MTTSAVETVLIEGVNVPLDLVSPDLNRAQTIPLDTRVISADATSALSAAHDGKLLARNGDIPVAGMIVSRSHGKAIRHSDRTQILEVFPRSSSRRNRMHQLNDFARRYAAVLRNGMSPLVVVPDAGKQGGMPEDDAHVQAFVVGMVASAMMPKGALLCASTNENPQNYGRHFAESDTLAMAASQGRAALQNRRILNGEPEWRHIAPQLERYKRQFKGFHENRRGHGNLAKHYLWVERDPRSIHGDPAFAPYHTVLLMSYPMEGTAPSLEWTEGLIGLMRPGSNYGEDPARKINTFRHWLAVNGRALATGDDIETALTLSRPEGKRVTAEADAAPALGARRSA